MVVTTRTNSALIDAMREAAARVSTVEDARRQRVEFIISALQKGGGVTRDQVEDVLARQAK